MERKHTITSDEKYQFQSLLDTKKPGRLTAFLDWWYRLAAPPKLPASASFSLRERVRHGRQAALSMPIFMLFLLTLSLQAFVTKNPGQAIAALMGFGTCVLILFLNREGFLKEAGVLALVLLYAGGTLTMLAYPHGLSLNTLYQVDFSILPDVVVLAFFSANSLFLIVGLNVFQIWAVFTFGPHDPALAYQLHTAPFQIYSHIYTLQLITAAVLYLCVRSTEVALARADRAEEIIAFELREKKLRELELEKKRHLEAGIQEILQTHVAVANGDLNIRAPLHQDHVLWQVAASLNNLIARLQSTSLNEWKLRQQMLKEDERISNNYARYERQTGASIPSIPKVEKSKGQL